MIIAAAPTPPAAKPALTTSVTVSLTAEEKAALYEDAKKAGTSMSALGRQRITAPTTPGP